MIRQRQVAKQRSCKRHREITFADAIATLQQQRMRHTIAHMHHFLPLITLPWV
jgi:hypothetical protein